MVSEVTRLTQNFYTLHRCVVVRKMKIYLLSLCVILIACSGSNLQSAQWKPAGSGLLTFWAEKIAPDNVLTEYPRPQMVREKWLNLNGLWNYAILSADVQSVQKYDGKILVPFPVESAFPA